MRLCMRRPRLKFAFTSTCRASNQSSHASVNRLICRCIDCFTSKMMNVTSNALSRPQYDPIPTFFLHSRRFDCWIVLHAVLHHLPNVHGASCSTPWRFESKEAIQRLVQRVRSLQIGVLLRNLFPAGCRCFMSLQKYCFWKTGKFAIPKQNKSKSSGTNSFAEAKCGLLRSQRSLCKHKEVRVHC